MKAVQVSTTQDKALQIFSKLPIAMKRAMVSPLNKMRVAQVKKLDAPKMLMLYVTDNCNLRCKHCFYWKEVDNPRNAHSIEQVEALTKSLKYPLDLLTLTGGEPFIRKDLVDIVRLFVENNHVKRIHIATNGLLPDLTVRKTNEMLVILGDTRLTMQFSIDGFEGKHDEVRGMKGAYQKTCETVKKLNEIRDKRLAVSVATVVHRDNFHEMAELKYFINHELGVPMKINVLRKPNSVRGVAPQFLEALDIREDDGYEPPSEEQLTELAQMLDDGTIASRIEKKKIEHSITILHHKKKAVDCLAGIRDATIFSNGDVSICEPTTPFANLKDFDYNFDSLWHSPAAVERKEKILGKCFCLNSCNLLNAMQYDTETLVNL
ncbi:radical SAM protein [Candidatus Woesearchaeota archaeon]|nr:radical SAM protein [Candidatus Woesearchaeota archaeon]